MTRGVVGGGKKNIRALSARQLAKEINTLRVERITSVSDDWVADGRTMIKHKALHDAVVKFIDYTEEVTERVRDYVDSAIANATSDLSGLEPSEPPFDAFGQTVRKYLPKAECKFRSGPEGSGVYYWFLAGECVAVCMEYHAWTNKYGAG